MRFVNGERRRRVVGRRLRARDWVVVSAALVGLGGCGKTDVGAGSHAANASAPAAVVSVVTAPAKREPMGIAIEAVGTTRANESVQVTSKASNTVIGIHF